ncbi:sulfotransferase family 2 domain-containing protein [Jannaschia formosa]|uniref:sulfotransferase family 2 domain-containing protein n=1 Tax=Jannaschia formosa TaxID=2259592 RepID=UPI000E1BB8DA|nr:sulfotransferase family 2 domain-containing protein [Jannaschia formosa]TFL19214.1 hypothetical protein DR046_04605 [Jannaschia formosa]
MLVSHPHQFVYLKTRKTAGTSVEMALQPLCTDAPAPVVEETHAVLGARGVVGMRRVEAPRRDALDEIWYNHMPAAAIRGLIGKRLWDRYAKVACIRDPFERMVSMFHWRRDLARRGASPDASQATLVAEFRDFVRTGTWNDDREIVQIDGRSCVDVVLRQEHLAADLAGLESRLSLAPGTLDLPRTKVGRAFRQGFATADYYDAPTMRLVRDRLAWVWDLHPYPETPMEMAHDD